MLLGILEFLAFLLAAIFCFTIPGLWILVKTQTRFSNFENLVLGTTLGLIIFTLLGYIFFVLNLQILATIPVIVLDILYLKNFRKSQTNFRLLPKQQLILLSVFLAIGITLQLLVISPSGTTINGSTFFWSAHAHDVAWHIGLMNSIQNGWPLQNPEFAGNRVVNYHFFSDIAPSYFNSFFRLPSLDLYFKFFPLIYTLLFGSLAYMVGKQLTNSFWGGFWSLIFADFAGSFGYIVTFFRDGQISGESLFWASQPQSVIGNPPQIVALIILLYVIYLLQSYTKQSKTFFWLIFPAVGSAIVFKVYIGLTLLGALAICSFWQIIKDRKLDLLYLFLPSVGLSLLLYLPNTSSSTSLVAFEPWAYIRAMVAAPDRLNLLDWELKRQTYISQGNWKRVLQLETQAFLLFLIGNLGMRFVGFLSLPRFIKSSISDYTIQLILAATTISFVFPLLFVQKGDSAGTTQFLQYFLLGAGIFAASAVVKFGQKVKLLPVKVFLGSLLILLAIPTQLGLLHDFYKRPPYTQIDTQEQQALNFLAQDTPKTAVILNPAFDKYVKINNPIPPIWAWADSAYIGAFANRSEYLSDMEQVQNMGYDFMGRKNLQAKVFQSDNPKEVEALLNQSGASYLYFPTLQRPKVDLTQTSLRQVFANSEIEIWQIN